jgi:hypothetical protein
VKNNRLIPDFLLICTRLVHWQVADVSTYLANFLALFSRFPLRQRKGRNNRAVVILRPRRATPQHELLAVMFDDCAMFLVGIPRRVSLGP